MTATSTAPAVAAWVVLGPLAAILITIAAGRLLGARRGWASMLISGVVGWTCAVLATGALAGWEWDTANMVLVALAFGTLFTMMTAIGLDLLAPRGTLARGERAGLITVGNPLRGVRQAARPIRRYREVLQLARANGVTRQRPTAQALPPGLSQTLEQAGGMFVKLGQVASTRPDLLPPEWCEELARLRSQAEPASEESIRPVLEVELGQPVDQLYGSFDWRPMASASIAQVYPAELPDGRSVVVKVQRPGLDDLIARDGAAIMQLAGLVERRTPLGLAVRPTELAAEFIGNVREELDFRIEAANATALSEVLAGSAGVRVPAVVPELSTGRVLTEERVVGTSIADTARLQELGLAPRELADRLLDTFLTQIFEAGIFHSDPHPGNILVEDDGTIALIDLGAVGRLGPGQRSSVLALMTAVAAGDALLLRQALTRLTVLDATADLRQLDFALDELLVRHVHAGGHITAEAFQDLTVLAGRYGMHLPRWFATLSRTMVTLEGTLRCVDPTFSLVDAAQEHARRRLGPRAQLTSARGALEHEALVQLPRLQRLPERIDELLGQAVEGRLSTRVSLFSHRRDEQLLRSLIDRLALALLSAALGVGSVLLLGVERGPTLSSSVTVNEVLGYVGLASASVLMLRVVAGVIRDGTT